MKKISDFIKKHRVLLIFFCFFLLVAFQYQFLYLYHDDYGYASLSYAVDIGNEGMHYGFFDILQFLWLHYLNWGGRISNFFVECLLLRIGLPVYRLAQSIVVTLIFYQIYAIVKQESNVKDYKIAIFVSSLYGVFSLMNVRDSFFWITAAVNYIFPILYFLILIREDKSNNKLLTYAQHILIFLTAFSHEQTSAMLVFYLLLTLIVEKIKYKKIEKVSIIKFVISLVGFSLLLFCPGNNVRKMHSPEFYNLNIFRKLLITVPNTITGVFSEYNNHFYVLFFFALIIVSVVNVKNNKIKNKILKNLILLSAFSNIMLVCLSTFVSNNYFAYLMSLSNNIYVKIFIILIIILQILLMIYSFIIYFGKKNVFYIKLLLSAFAYLTPMLISSYFPERSVIGFQLVMLVIITKVIFDIYERQKYKCIFDYIIISIVIFSIINYSTITTGYYKNKKINDYNNIVLIKASNKIKHGENIKKIKLKKFENMYYAIDPPYIEGFEYIKIWIKKYYEIPQNIELLYE